MKPLVVGVRVRIVKHPPSLDLSKEYGVVKRLDARGALVRLDSGKEFLVEPAMLEVIE